MFKQEYAVDVELMGCVVGVIHVQAYNPQQAAYLAADKLKLKAKKSYQTNQSINKTTMEEEKILRVGEGQEERVEDEKKEGQEAKTDTVSTAHDTPILTRDERI